MKRSTCVLLIASLALLAQAQPELYSDSFVGFPEFRLLVLRQPAANPDSARLDVHIRVLYDDLQFVKQGDRFIASYSLDAVLKREQERVVGNRHIEREVLVENFTATNSRSAGDQTFASFALLPDARYNLRVSLTDRESRKERFLEKEVVFSGKEWDRGLRLSDPALLDSTGGMVMAVGVLSGQTIRAAYSMYSEDSTEKTVEFHLMDSHDQEVTSSSFTIPLEQRFHADTLGLTQGDLPAGSYRLILSAQSGDDRIARAYAFKILGQDLPDFIQDVDLAIRQLKYIASDDEAERFDTAAPPRREQLFREFWRERDPSPATPANEKMDEYYRRVRYANEHFSALRDGWETDMGRIYIIFGAPTEVERHPFDIDKKPYEIWYYHDLNRSFLFVDENGFGDYRLKSPLWHEY